MDMHCNVILDLIPLVKDGVASTESSHLVKAHVKGCESCKVELDAFEDIRIDQLQIKDQKIIFDIKRSIYITQMFVLVIGAIIGIALSNSMGMFYNFIIMPIIGGVSFITFKRKWVVAPLVIFIVTYSWQTFLTLLENGLSWAGLSVGLFYSSVYTFLVALGVVITILLKFAFKKGEKNEK